MANYRIEYYPMVDGCPVRDNGPFRTDTYECDGEQDECINMGMSMILGNKSISRPFNARIYWDVHNLNVLVGDYRAY